jgi:hypothetical protein
MLPPLVDKSGSLALEQEAHLLLSLSRQFAGGVNISTSQFPTRLRDAAGEFF